MKVQYGNTLDKDSGEFASSVVFGVGDGDTDITGVMNYYHRNSIFNHDRGYSNHTSKFFASTNSSPFNLQLSRDAVLAAGVPPTALPDDLDTFFGHAPFFTNGTAPATDYKYTPSRSSSTSMLSPKRCLIQNAMAGLLISTTRYAVINW